MTILFRTVVALIGATVLALGFTAASFATEVSTAPITLDRPPPGKYVGIGRLNLYIYCKGHGNPTVVFDSGIGGGSLEWLKVQDQLATHMRACAYDRAGYGWSMPGPFPRTTEQIVVELHLLLKGYGLTPPFILVGHSFGGFNVRYFAARYPKEVAGLVLVDSSDPAQGITVEAATGSRPIINPIKQDARVMHDGIPTTPLQIESYLNTRRRAIYTQMNEIANFANSAREVEAAGPLPDVPLMVLTHGRRVWPPGAEGDKREAQWKILQRKLADLTPQGQQEVVKNAGHNIQIDNPGAVAAAVLKVASKYRLDAARRSAAALASKDGKAHR